MNPTNTQVNNNFIKVVCDECSYEFKLDAIKQEQIVLGGKDFKLNYFSCPKCNKIYKINLEDKKLKNLIEALNFSKKALNASYGKGNKALVNLILKTVNKKQEQVKKYVGQLSKKFPGTFEELNGKIVYKK